jgi:hypothetical protein
VTTVDDAQRPSDGWAAPAVVPEEAPGRLCELTADTRAAVLLDAEGGLAGSSDPERAEELAEAARDLLRAADRAASEPPAELEAQVLGGSVFAVRRPGWTLVAVGRRSALSSLMLYDMRAMLAKVEAAA